VLLVLLALAALIAWRLKPGAFGELRQDLVWHGPSADRMGDVSRDGRFLCFTDPDSEQLRVRDLKSGKSWMVTSKPAQSRAGGARNCTWSPDGRWIAYQKDMGDRLEVRSVSIKGLEDRLLMASRDTTVFFPGDWSADGSRVAIVACLPDQTRLSEIDHSSGAAVRTYRLAGCPNVARLSADGDWLAHDLRDNAPSGAIHVVSTKTSSSQAIASGRVGLVDWTPDGRGLVYTASSSATDVVVAPIREGRLAGDSLSLVKALGPARPIAITGAGDFYYALRTGHPATYIAEIDARNQKCLRAASRMDAPESIQPVQADWTPDGQAISFVRWFDGTAVYTRQGNSLAMLVPKLDRVSLATIRWSPDGGSLLAAAGGENYVIGLYRIHRNDGSVQPLRRSHDLSTFYYDPIQSAFNGAVYYKLRRYMVEPSRLFEMFPNSDRPDREVIPSVYSFALSRDGRLLVYSSFDARDEFIRILDLASGATTELHREKRQGRIVSVAFTPDSQFVLYAQRGQLWRLPAAGGAPAMLPLNMEGMRDLRPHPDGRRLAFSAGTRDMSDLWVMRNAFSR
jgi:Tol biopolymer transport system component